jgi:hypothetical protein
MSADEGAGLPIRVERLILVYVSRTSTYGEDQHV